MNTIYLCTNVLIRLKYTFLLFTVITFYYLQTFLFIFLRARVCGPSFVYVTHFVFLRDIWIRTQKAAAASRRTSNLATHLTLLQT